MSDVRPLISEQDAQSQLRNALSAAGVDVARVGMPILDGQRHYVPLVGQRGKQKSAAYRGYYDGTRPAGAIWNHKTGEVTRWRADGEIVQLSDGDRRKLESERAIAAERREHGRATREIAAAQTAQRMLNESTPASPNHPYLQAKGVQPHGIRETERGDLLIPLRDADGALWNVQTISADGRSKLYLAGARKVGVHYVLGDVRPGDPLAIAEGFATAASVREATGATVAMALDTGNLLPVARVYRDRESDKPLAMVADNDAHLPLRPLQPSRSPLKNEGMVKAEAVAKELGASVLLAPEIPERTAADKGTDWNDYAVKHGRDATSRLLQPALNGLPQKSGERDMIETAVDMEKPAPERSPPIPAARDGADTPRLSPDAQIIYQALSRVVEARQVVAAEDLKQHAMQALGTRETRDGPVELTPDTRTLASQPPGLHDLAQFETMVRQVQGRQPGAEDRITGPQAVEVRESLESQMGGVKTLRDLQKLYSKEDVQRSMAALSRHPEEERALKTTMEATEARLLTEQRGLNIPPPPAPPHVADAAPSIEITRRGDNGGPSTSTPPFVPRGYTMKEQDGERLYYQASDNKLAIHSSEQRIQGVLRDDRTIGAMLDIAASRGWNDVQIKGDRDVARDTWIEATARGMKVEGYSPTREDRHAADQRRVDREDRQRDRADDLSSPRKINMPSRSLGL